MTQSPQSADVLDGIEPIAWVIQAAEYDITGALTHQRDIDYYQSDVDELKVDAKLYCEDTVRRLLAEQEKRLAEQRLRADELRDVLIRGGFVECDISACNCGSWHARYGLPERMNEIKDALAENGHPLSNENGHLVLNALNQLIEERDRLASPAVVLPTGWYVERLAPDCLAIRNGNDGYGASAKRDQTLYRFLAAILEQQEKKS